MSPCSNPAALPCPRPSQDKTATAAEHGHWPLRGGDGTRATEMCYPEGTRPLPQKARGEEAEAVHQSKKKTLTGSLLFRSCRDVLCGLPSAEGRVTLSETLRFPDTKGGEFLRS